MNQQSTMHIQVYKVRELNAGSLCWKFLSLYLKKKALTIFFSCSVILSAKVSGKRAFKGHIQRFVGLLIMKFITCLSQIIVFQGGL